MHIAAYQFLAAWIRILGPYKTVVECGGRDLNGSPRALCDTVDYVSVDLYPGPGVDVVQDFVTWVHDYDREADLVICAEVLEHAPNPAAILQAAGIVLRTGGYLLVTCATEGRAEHSGITGNDHLEPGEYYRNVNPRDLLRWADHAGFGLLTMTRNPRASDLYLAAVKT